MPATQESRSWRKSSPARKSCSSRAIIVLGRSIPASKPYADGVMCCQITRPRPTALTRAQTLERRPHVRPRDAACLVAAAYMQNSNKSERRHPNSQNLYGKGLADETRRALTRSLYRKECSSLQHKGRQGLHRDRLRALSATISIWSMSGHHQESGLIVRQCAIGPGRPS